MQGAATQLRIVCKRNRLPGQVPLRRPSRITRNNSHANGKTLPRNLFLRASSTFCLTNKHIAIDRSQRRWSKRQCFRTLAMQEHLRLHDQVCRVIGLIERVLRVALRAPRIRPV